MADIKQAEFDGLSQAERVARLEQMARAALARWPVGDALLALLKYRENAIFKVTATGSGEQFVLRLHRPGYHSDAELRSELQWMDALRESGIETPAPVPATSGDAVVTVSHHAVPEPRQCDLLRWIEGAVVGDVEGGHVGSAEELRASHVLVGRLAARIHSHGERWQRPPGFTRPHMDFDGLVGTRPYWGPYRACALLTPDQMALLDRSRDGIAQALAAFGQGPDRYGLTHGDFLPENLLLHGDSLRIIDFDDCGFGWHVMDVATSLLWLLGQPQYDAALAGFVEGYRSLRALPDEHLAMLPVFLLARAMTYVGWVGSRPETPMAREKGPLVVGVTLYLAQQFLGAAP